MVTRNSLSYSRKVGILTALGLSLGMVVHVTYSLVGLAYIISQSVIIFNIIKALGGLYLIYLGVKVLLSKSIPPGEQEVSSTVLSLSNWGAIRMGFLTNVLNPKVTLFFLAVFTQAIDAHTPFVIKIGYASEMTLATFLWFSLVSYMFSHSIVRARIAKMQKYIDKVFGSLMVLIGLKVLTTK